MSWIANLLGRSKPPPPPPVMLRVREPDGRLPSAVELTATWYPSQRSFTKTQRPALGLCAVPWFANETHLELTIRTGDASATVTVDRDREDRNRALDVALAPSVGAALSA